MLFATDGIISRVCDVGVSDKLVNIITPDRGRIGVIVKGGRSPGSKITPLAQLYTYGNFEIYEKNSTYWLRGGSVINPFFDLSIDITRVSLAAYFCDVANELTDEGDECEEILKLLLNSLYLVGRGEKDQRIIKAVFELRAAAISGYLPEASCCAYCNSTYADLMYLDVMGGRLVCTDCMSKRGSKAKISKDFEDVPEATVLCGMTQSVTAALRFILYSKPNKVFSFDLKDEGELDDLGHTAEAYILNHLGRSFDSLDFYKTVK